MLQVFALLALLALATFIVLVSGKSTIRHIQGPATTSWILGNQPELMQSEAGVANRLWCRVFGTVYRFRSCFGVEWLMLNDPKAIAHVLQGQTTTYHFEESLREFLRQALGKGLAYADGPEHARQRRLLQPSFSPPFVKGLTPQFADCASRVIKEWQRLLNENGDTAIEVNMYEWAERLAMEAIGQTVFGVRFGAIEGEDHQLARAYKGFLSTAFSQPTKLFIALQAFALHIPPWLLSLIERFPVKRLQALRTAKASSLAFTRALIQEKRHQEENAKGSADRDVLSILTKAGEEDVRGHFTRMSEEEIHAQLTTIFVAGYETSCTVLSFALYEISRDSNIQQRLHAEVAGVFSQLPENTPDYSDLQKMTYLQAVVKETLRLHTVVTHGVFQAGMDDTIPLSRTITTTRGDTVDAVPVRKGQRVFISLDGVNRSQDIWGKDASQFNPERWLDDRDQFSLEDRCGGPYANLANFGGGPKTCIGWRFAVTELQTFIAVLVNKFRFEIASDFHLRRDGCSIVIKPTGKGQELRGPWMPLRVELREI